MTSFLRPLAYRYRWIYDTVTAVSSLSVGGVERLRGLGLEAVQPHLKPGAAVLDLCCGSGEAAAPWLAAGYAVTGLDVSPRALDLAAQRHPNLKRVEGLAEDPPLADASFSQGPAGCRSTSTNQPPGSSSRRALRSTRSRSLRGNSCRATLSWMALKLASARGGSSASPSTRFRLGWRWAAKSRARGETSSPVTA